MNDSTQAVDPHLLAGLLAATPDCVLALDADGSILFMNARGLALNEISSEESIRGKKFADLWPLAEREKVSLAIADAAAGSIAQFEGYCPTALGKPRWWEVRLAPVASKRGKALRIAAISRDISGRRETELAARATEEKFALLLESSGDGIYGMALDSSCIFINRAGASMLGHEPAALIGRSLHEIIHHHRADGAFYPITECEIFKAARSGTARRVDDEVFWHRDGSAIPVTYSVFPMIVEGNKIGTVVTFSDTTERRRVEQDLRRFAAELSHADRRKTEFLATLAHELRNPLAPLRNGLELLAKSGDSPQSVAQVREMMQRQLAQLVHLINDLLDVARIATGKLELKREAVDLRRIVRIALEAANPIISDAGHHLKIVLPEAPVPLAADVTRLTQVLTNILNNAAKYTPPGGSITVAVAMGDHAVEIAVTDTGVGIAPQSLTAVFEMFTQVGRETHSVPGGLGIGLNLARRLVELHGGGITAESAGIGEGTTIKVRLPLAATSYAKHDDGSRRAAAAAPPSMRILIVDDNSDVAESMQMLLGMGQHTVRVARSGQEALEILKTYRPEVAFLDIGMPLINGYELAREIRRLPGLDPLVLVALTGWGGEDDRQRSADAGFDDHLTKPVDFESIERLLTRFSATSGSVHLAECNS